MGIQEKADILHPDDQPAEIQTTRAAALLGTECVLVGIAPSIARTLVQIGVDFGSLTTRRDLQAGVAYALEQRAEDEEMDSSV